MLSMIIMNRRHLMRLVSAVYKASETGLLDQDELEAAS